MIRNPSPSVRLARFRWQRSLLLLHHEDAAGSNFVEHSACTNQNNHTTRTSHTVGQFTGAFKAYVVNVMYMLHSGRVKLDAASKTRSAARRSYDVEWTPIGLPFIAMTLAQHLQGIAVRRKALDFLVLVSNHKSNIFPRTSHQLCGCWFLHKFLKEQIHSFDLSKLKELETKHDCNKYFQMTQWSIRTNQGKGLREILKITRIPCKSSKTLRYLLQILGKDKWTQRILSLFAGAEEILWNLLKFPEISKILFLKQFALHAVAC